VSCINNIPRKNFKTIHIFQIAPTEHIAYHIGQRTSFIRVTAGSITSTFDNPFGRDLSVQEEEEETSLLLLAVSQDIVEDDTEKRILPIG
jgi:hypothetical protein